MNNNSLLAIAAGLTLFASPAAAEPQCGQDYIVQAGDSLSDIAAKVLGDPVYWERIYEHHQNAFLIGENPNAMPSGITLEMPPCPRSSELQAGAPASVRVPGQVVTIPSGAATTPAPVAATPTLAAPAQPPEVSEFAATIEIVTGSDYPPFADENWPGRGMITQIVEAAFAAQGARNKVRIDMIHDWNSHLTKLLPRGKYAMGFPWVKPNCDNPSELAETMRARCDYVWSKPLYTYAITLFSPKADPNPPTSFVELQGRSVCRPSNYHTFDLHEHGLWEGENFTLLTPRTVAECFALLERGEVDYVSINRFTGERAISDAGLGEYVEPVRTLVDPRSLHLVAHTSNSQAAQEWMNIFNSGLEAIQRTGQWDQIINWHLDRHRDTLN